MNSVFIVYTPDWEGIELYFDELSAYKAAVKSKSDVVQVGQGDIKEQVKNPRKFNDQPKENNNGNQKENRSNRNSDQPRRSKEAVQGAGQLIDPNTPNQSNSNQSPRKSSNPLEDRPADLAAAFNDIDFSASQRPNPKPGS